MEPNEHVKLKVTYGIFREYRVLWDRTGDGGGGADKDGEDRTAAGAPAI